VSVDPPPGASAHGGDTPPPGPAPYPEQYGHPPEFGRPPGYGWRPPATPPPGFYPPPYSPIKRTPNAWWYAVGAALLVIGLLISGAGIGVIVNAFNAQPDSGQTFASGESTTLHFADGATKVIYVDSGAAGRHHIECNVSNVAERVAKISRYHGNLTINRWEAAFTVTASESGDYTIECTGAPSDTFGVGDNAAAGTFIAGVFGIAAGAGMTLAGIAALVLVAVLRWRRKSAHGQVPPPGPQGSYGA
jgi:hypothetical protein